MFLLKQLIGAGFAAAAAAANGYRSTILADSPVAYYRLGESSGTTASDETGNYDATYVASPTLGETGAISGDSSTSVLLASASSQYAEIDSNLSITAYPFTIEAWVKTTATAEGVVGSFVVNTTNNQMFALRVSASGIAYTFARNTSGVLAESTTAVNDGNWHHIVAVFAASNDRIIYVDGAAEDTHAANVTLPAINRFSIGRLGDTSPGAYFNGTVDEVAVYDTALSASTILAHYNAGFATLVPNVITSANSSDITTTIDCSSVTEGYLMIIFVTLWATRSITSYPSSWNLERTGTEGTSSGQSRLYVFSKIAAATETTYDFTVDNILYGARLSYSLLEIPKTGLGVRGAAYSQDGVLGSIYSYSTDTLHLALCGKADSTATEDVIHPSGYTEIVDRTGSLYNHAIAYKEISGASRALSNGTDAFTDPDNTGATGDNNISTIHLAISDAGPIISETFEGTGAPAGFANSISGSGTIDYDHTTNVLEGSKSLHVYSDSDTYSYLDLGSEYDHIVAVFGYYSVGASNRTDVTFCDSALTRDAYNAIKFGSVSAYVKGIAHAYNNIFLTLTGTVNTFHYVRVELDKSGGVVKIARSNDKTSFPTSGTNYAEDLTASFNSQYGGTQYIVFGFQNRVDNSYYDDIEVTAL